MIIMLITLSVSIALFNMKIIKTIMYGKSVTLLSLKIFMLCLRFSVGFGVEDSDAVVVVSGFVVVSGLLIIV